MKNKSERKVRDLRGGEICRGGWINKSNVNTVVEGSLGEKGVGVSRRQSKKGGGRGLLNVTESKRNREKYATLCSTLQLKKCKEMGANKNRAGHGIKGYRKQAV